MKQWYALYVLLCSYEKKQKVSDHFTDNMSQLAFVYLQSRVKYTIFSHKLIMGSKSELWFWLSNETI